MLKNKEERKKYLEDDSNWNIIYILDNIGLRYSEIKFSNNISLIKVERYEYCNGKGQYVVEGYRLLDHNNLTLSRNTYYISACVEFLKNHELA